MDRLCIFLNGRFNFFIIKWVYKGRCNSVLRQCMGQQVICAAVNMFSRYNVVSRMGQILKCICNGCCSGSNRQSCHTAFKRCDTLFEHILCRICQTSVNIARILKAKPGSRMVTVSKYIRRCLINRHCPCISHRVRLFLSYMQL